MVKSVDNAYSDFYISRRQAQQICFAIIDQIDSFCAEHAEEFLEFLKSEEDKGKGGKNGQSESAINEKP